MTVRRAVAVTAIALAFAPATATAGEGLSLAPSRIDVTAGWGERIPQIEITNEGTVPLEIVAQPLPATQDPQGLPRYEHTAATRREGNRRFAVSPRKAVVGPGRKRAFRVTVGACPSDGLGLYGVVTFQAMVAGRERRTRGGRGAPRVELATTLLVRYPPKGCMDGTIAAARVEQRGDRLALVADVRSLGSVHGRPLVDLLVKRGGFVVRRVRVKGENVLPGAVRSFAAVVGRPALAAGRYDLVVRGRFGHGKLQQRTSFVLSETNRLAAPDLRLEDVRVQDTAPGRRPWVLARVRNRGNRAGGGDVRLALSRAGSGRTLIDRAQAVKDLGAGSSTTLRLQGPELAVGAYSASAVLRAAEREPVEREEAFAVQAAPSVVTRLQNWLLAHPELLLAGAAGLLALVAVGGVVLGRRRVVQPARAS